MSETAPPITAEELERYPDDDCRCELVEGRLIRMSPIGFSHDTTVARCLFLLGRHLEGRHLGAVRSEVGFKLASSPDTVRAPDIAFLRQTRLGQTKPRGFWQGPPDLAIEVMSPEDRPDEILAKVDEYLRGGVSVAVLIDSDRSVVGVYRPSAFPLILNDPDDRLDLDDVIPGFACTLRDLFA
jgi:Uma2 family endonuclease